MAEAAVERVKVREVFDASVTSMSVATGFLKAARCNTVHARAASALTGFSSHPLLLFRKYHLPHPIFASKIRKAKSCLSVVVLTSPFALPCSINHQIHFKTTA